MATIAASDNEFPKVLLAEGAAAATPDTGLVVVYAKADGKVYSKDDAGTETELAAASAALAAHLADTSDAHDASAISVLDTLGSFTGTDVEAVLAELFAAIGAGGIPATIIDAKGDLIAGSAADTAARLAVGSNGYELVADSAQSTGLRWEDRTIGTFTPTWTGGTPSIGNGTLTGHYQKMADKLYWICIRLVAGSTTNFGSGGTNYAFGNLPFTVKSTSPSEQVAAAVIVDSGTASFSASARFTQGQTSTAIIVAADGGGSRHVTSTIPMTWANGDSITIQGVLASD